jgi:plastocyanin
MRSSRPFLRLTRTAIPPLTLIVLFAHLAGAQWTAQIGAQSQGRARQALAFLPNELWVHAGDSITWTMFTDEPHTVTFLTANQIRPPFAVGCPGFSSSPATFDGTTCVTTPPLGNGAAFTVIFPTAGNFKLVCLFHENMSGTIHVLDPSATLPHDQAYYDAQGKLQRRALLLDVGFGDSVQSSGNTIIVGGGEVVATPGGTHTLSVMRFSQRLLVIHVGDTVEWANVDSITPHTITFGAEPQNPIPPSPNVTVDADGARHGTLNSPSDSVHSGFIRAAPQDRLGLAQAPPGVTRFRVTFLKRGFYPYVCVLHDGLGMKGTIVVEP